MADLAALLREQAQWCRELGSPLYAHLLERAAEDALAGGPVRDVLAALDPGDALALRFMAAVHRLVLTGQAPPLATHYPSAGGDGKADGAWEAFRALVAERVATLQALGALPCQTNEVGRCAALVFAFLVLGPTPLRLLEVGASAGLNLRWDHFRYGGGGAHWGDALSPVDLTGLWKDAPPRRPPSVDVVERRGCDRRPIDPLSAEGRLSLEASVWADQTARLARLRGAIAVAARVPAVIDTASLETWLPDQLQAPRPGVTTVVFHSIVEDYLGDDARRALRSALEKAGARAGSDAPLAWVRLEPLAATRTYGVTLTTWPGGEERLLARSGAHGTGVTRANAP